MTPIKTNRVGIGLMLPASEVEEEAEEAEVAEVVTIGIAPTTVAIGVEGEEEEEVGVDEVAEEDEEVDKATAGTKYFQFQHVNCQYKSKRNSKNLLQD